VLASQEANLLDFPVPKWHEADGGRYAGTGCAVFTTDPDTGTLNAGAYRMQVQNGGRAATVNMEAGKHGAAHVRAWFAREGRAPVTVSLGHDPLLLVVAGTEVPRGRSPSRWGTIRCCSWWRAPRSRAAYPSSNTRARFSAAGWRWCAAS
jgi:4-hydroxy-3-polyprenylbenzoate decarboxylase